MGCWARLAVLLMHMQVVRGNASMRRDPAFASMRSDGGESVIGSWARLAIILLRTGTIAAHAQGLREAVAAMSSKCISLRAMADAAERRAKLYANHALEAHELMFEESQRRVNLVVRNGVHQPWQANLEEKSRQHMERSRALLAIGKGGARP